MRSKRLKERVTVTLDEGHRQRLQEIADQNRVKLAFVVRFAIAEFLGNPNRGESLLDFRSNKLDSKRTRKS